MRAQLLAANPTFPASMRPADLWRFLRLQPASYWATCAYVFFEYVRPQQIYSWLSVIPWPKICLIVALILWLVEGAAIRGPVLLNIGIAAFGLIILASSATAQYPAVSWSWEAQSLILNWIILYIIVSGSVTTEGRVFLFTAFFLLWSLKMSQHATRTWVLRGFGFASWGASGAPGWFQNSGEMGIQMCVMFPMAVWFVVGIRDRLTKWPKLILWACALSAVPAAIASSSRGALVGLGAVGVWMLLQIRKVRAAVALVALAGVVYWALPAESKTRFESMGDDETSQSRLTYWRHGIQIMKANPVTGIGYSNWVDYYRNEYGGKQLPHNFLVQAGAELGVTGLVIVLGLMGATFIVNAGVRRRMAPLGQRGHLLHSLSYGLDGAMVGFAASGFFVSVLYYPYLYMNVAMTAALGIAATQLARSADTVPRPAGPPIARSAGWRTATSAARPLVGLVDQPVARRMVSTRHPT